MITSLSIKNYALIEDIQVDFGNGLTIITGETGAGKSILLGALSLVLGKRADLSSVKNTSKKCIVEATFDIANYSLKSFFDEEDLDYESQSILRREILPSGKSRAFVNDTPVNLSVLSSLGDILVDIHSQHQNLELTDNHFQFQIIDAFADNSELLDTHYVAFDNYKTLKHDLENLIRQKSELIKEQDYNIFLLNELLEAKLDTINLGDIEAEYETLSNVEDIKLGLQEAYQLLNDDQVGILQAIARLKQTVRSLAELSSNYYGVFDRLTGVEIEIDDIYNEIEDAKDRIEADPERLDQLNTTLDTIQDLFKKHGVSSTEELVEIQDQLSSKIDSFEAIDDQIEALEIRNESIKKELTKLSLQLHERRKKALPGLKAQLIELLSDLGMPNAQFKIGLEMGDNYLRNGRDTLSFLFTANKGEDFKSLRKAASGGELSRIMLAIKSVIAKYSQLPTIIFDEIDTGVSGEISNRMAEIMKRMSTSMQVLTITHLPQIAAKGDTHFKVYKSDDSQQTTTHLTKLNSEERIVEIAEMLSGKKISTSAMAHAKQLLN